MVLPCILGQIVNMAAETIALVFVGQLNDAEKTAGVGISICYVNVLCLSLLVGLNNAIPVLVAISHGAKDLHNCEVILSRGRLLCTLLFIPVIFLMLQCENILLLISIDEQVAAHAQTFTYCLIPAKFFYLQFDCYRHYFNATGQSHITLLAFCATIPLHFYWCHLFVNLWEYDIKGAALAMCITSLLNFLIMLIYAARYSTLFVCRKQVYSITGVKEYLKIAVPSMLMLCLEWWAYEILAFSASWISVSALGA